LEFNKNQLKAINHYKGNCCTLASAGSGKTTVLVNRIVNLIKNHKVNPSKILAITFSKKAANNMIERLNKLIPNNRVNIYTFHALGFSILKEKGYYNELFKDWEKLKLINDICIKMLKLESDELDVPTRDIISFIAYQKNNLIRPTDTYIENTISPYDEKTMRKIYTLYEKQKTKIDFEDMLINSYDVLKEGKYNVPYEFILGDEFQDTNKVQYEMLKLLNIHDNLFVVGDALQNIFEWRGSNNNYIVNFYRDWSNATIINLNTNYRSSDNIVKFSNSLVKNTIETTHKYYIESKAYNEEYKNPIITEYSNEFEESMEVCKQINQLISDKQYKYGDIAILTRTNFQMQSIERSLYNSKIPYDIVDGNKFYELKEIRDMINYLRLISDTSNDEAFLKIFNVPNRYLGEKFIREVEKYAKKHKTSLFNSMQKFPQSTDWHFKKGINQLRDIICAVQDLQNHYTVGGCIQVIRDKLKYDKYISKDNSDNNDQNEKIENLDAFVNSANKYNKIIDFLNDIDSIINSKEESNDKVLMMTIHKSKGLEFPVVFVVGVSNGLLPHAKSNNINEEKRLLYVALTRSEKELFISSPKYYNNKYLGTSDFLNY